MFVMFCLVVLFVLICGVLAIKETFGPNKRTAHGNQGFDEFYTQQRFTEEFTRE